jgi:iron complex transport system substrate-binding protein
VRGIFGMIELLGAMVGAAGKAAALITELQQGLQALAADANALPRRPRVYFEEWDEPLISGIQWVAELIELAGGEDCFAELASEPLAKNRIIADPMEVARRDPDIIIGSWCGKRFRPEQVAARPGWTKIAAVRQGQLHEIESNAILQAGPAALTDGVQQIHALIQQWAAQAS